MRWSRGWSTHGRKNWHRRRRRGKSSDRHLGAGNFEELGPHLDRQLQRVGEASDDIFGGTARLCLPAADRRVGDAHALAKLGLGEIKELTSPSEPVAEREVVIQHL